MPWEADTQTFRFVHRYVVLTEGPSDKEFFSKLALNRGLPPFDAPWPVHEREQAPQGAKELRSLGKIHAMLSAIRTYVGTIPELRQQIALVIVAVDSADILPAKDWPQGFYKAVKEVRKAKGFGLPERPLQIAAPEEQTALPLAIMTVPASDRDGGLETLYADALFEKFDGIKACVENYFRTCPSRPNNWGAEKKGKGHFQCIVSSTNKSNPALPPAWALSERDGKPPLIDISDSAFNPLENDLRTLCQQAGLLA